MTEAEKNEIVGLVMTQISSQAVDFDIATEEPQANDLLTAVREVAGRYVGVTLKWDDVARIATELANQAAKRAEQAETDANNILTQVQSKGTEITNFVATSKAEIETQKNESVNEVRTVYQGDLNELKGDLDKYVKKINKFGNLLDISKLSEKGEYWVNGQKYNTTSGNQAKMVSVQVELEPNTLYHHALYKISDGKHKINSALTYINFFKSNGEFISYELGVLVLTGTSIGNEGQFTTPNETAYAMVTYVAYENIEDPNPSYYGLLSTNIVPFDYVPFVLYDLQSAFNDIKTLENDLNINTNFNSLRNKKVVCFGDSIFGMGTEEGTYRGVHTYLAEKGHCIAYNVGFGGCKMSSYSSDYYTWNAFCMHSLAKALYENDWSEQDNAISLSNSSEDGSPNKLSTYFEEHLNTLKSIDFNTVDFITISYGTNDWMSGKPLLPTDTDTVEWWSYIGALKYSIRLIQKKYPHIKIIVCTPIWRCFLENSVYQYSSDDKQSANANGVMLTEFVDACLDACKHIHILCTDNYNMLGINQYNWETYLLNEKTNAVHPTPNGNKKLGERIASFIISNC